MDKRDLHRAIVTAFGALLLAGCETMGAEPMVANAPEHPSLDLAQRACGTCHAVQASGLSSNPASPPFADIANRDGLTRQTLTTYLNDAHNYPEVMDFDLNPDQVDGLVDYILTLRSADYRNPG